VSYFWQFLPPTSSRSWTAGSRPMRPEEIWLEGFIGAVSAGLDYGFPGWGLRRRPGGRRRADRAGRTRIRHASGCGSPPAGPSWSATWPVVVGLLGMPGLDRLRMAARSPRSVRAGALHPSAAGLLRRPDRSRGPWRRPAVGARVVGVLIVSIALAQSILGMLIHADALLRLTSPIVTRMRGGQAGAPATGLGGSSPSFNPEWAVLSEPETRFGSWDLDEFLPSGE